MELNSCSGAWWCCQAAFLLLDNLCEDVNGSEDVVDMNLTLGKASVGPPMPRAERMSNLPSVLILEELEQESVFDPVN